MVSGSFFHQIQTEHCQDRYQIHWRLRFRNTTPHFAYSTADLHSDIVLYINTPPSTILSGLNCRSIPSNLQFSQLASPILAAAITQSEKRGA
jgi:hypothetical protein